MEKPLRKCIECGLEAHTKKDLELFAKDKKSYFGRLNLCIDCRKIRGKLYRLKNPLTHRYSGMITRCYSQKNSIYLYYGGRGISVCEEWRNDRQTFFDWANANGFKVELTLDRINNDGPYSPENCRWATRSQQNLNKRDTVTNLEKGTRICWKCKIEKPLSDFSKDKSTSFGHMYICKRCHSKYRQMRHRKKN